MNGITSTKESPLRELRAACKFFGVSQAGSKLRCFQRIMSHLKGRELKAAAEVAMQEKEVSREARAQAIVPVPTEEKQEDHALTHTLTLRCLHGVKVAFYIE